MIAFRAVLCCPWWFVTWLVTQSHVGLDGAAASAASDGEMVGYACPG